MVRLGPKCSTGRGEKPQSRAGEQTGGNRRNSWSKTEGCGSIRDRDEAGWSGTDEVGNRRSNSWSKTEGCGNIQDRDEACWSGTDEVGNRGSIRGKPLVRHSTRQSGPDAETGAGLNAARLSQVWRLGLMRRRG